jgi:hypothetical protein
MNPRVLPWGDIEAFGVSKIGNNEFTTIRVRSYRACAEGAVNESRLHRQYVPRT